MKNKNIFGSLVLLMSSGIALATVHVETQVSLYESEDGIVKEEIKEIFSYDIEYGHARNG